MFSVLRTCTITPVQGKVLRTVQVRYCSYHVVVVPGGRSLSLSNVPLFASPCMLKLVKTRSAINYLQVVITGLVGCQLSCSRVEVAVQPTEYTSRDIGFSVLSPPPQREHQHHRNSSSFTLLQLHLSSRSLSANHWLLFPSTSTHHQCFLLPLSFQPDQVHLRVSLALAPTILGSC